MPEYVNTDVEVYSKFICKECPVFELKTTVSYADGAVYCRNYACANLANCMKIIPHLQARLRGEYVTKVCVAKWETGDDHMGPVCSACGAAAPLNEGNAIWRSQYCPACGVKMTR